jgi:ribosomal protein S18 acetylase RimI-like enzyme
VNCRYCGNAAIYKCSVCGTLVCESHAKQLTVCPSCVRTSKAKYAVERASSKEEKADIRKLVRQFWGEEEQLTFDRKFSVSEQPACVANVGKKTVGFVSFVEDEDNLIIVALAVQTEHQGLGIGHALIEKVESEARRQQKKKLLVSTSNDNLPALGFYQSLGFQIFEVKPNAIAEKHGQILAGIGGLPMRDELRLQKILRQQGALSNRALSNSQPLSRLDQDN